jgi:hypothetical protein
MSIAATINGVTVPAGVLKPDFSLTWRLGGRGTGDVVLIDPAAAPVAGQSIAFFEDGVRVWSGAIDSVEASFLGDKTTGMMQYRLTLVSKEQRLSYRLVKPATTTADPSSTYVALSGTVNVGGTSVIWVSGDKFDRNLEKTKIHIGGSDYFVSSVSDSEHLTLTTSAGSGTGTAFSWTPYAGNIVRSLRHHWLQGEAISEGTIEDGDDVGKQVYDHAAVADIYTQLADGSDSIWYVNPEDELCFHARNTVTAGTALDEDNVLDNDPPTATETREDLCNARYQRISYNALDPDSAAIEGDGTAKDFWIDAPISVITAGSIQIGGTFYTCEFGLRGVDSGKDFYYSPGENKLTQEPSYSGTVIDATNASPIEIQTSAPHLLASGHLVFIDNIVGNTGANGQFWRINVTDTDKFEVIDSNGNGAYTSGGTVEANQPLDPGDWLRFNYRRLGSDVINYEDATAISARATVEGTSGRYERLEETTDSVDAAGALSLATAVVDAKKYTSTQARFSTLEKGYQPGQLVDVTVADFGFSADPFLIEEITARDQEDGTFRYTLSLVDGRALGGWRKVFEGLRGTAKGSSLSFVTGGSVVGSGSSTGSGGGTTTAPSDEVTVIDAGSEYYDWQDGNGIRLALFGTIVPPSPLGTFESESVYWEKDASNLPPAVADGGTLADGSENTGGDQWAPHTAFQARKHTDGKFRIDGLDPVPGDYRIYVNAVNSEGYENPLVRASQPGATPSVVITVPAVTASGGKGEEYCKNPVNCTATVTQAQEGGVWITHVVTTFDKDPTDVYGTGAYIEVPYRDELGNELVNVGVAQYGTGGDNYFTTPTYIQTSRVRFRGFSDPLNTPGVDDDNVNSYVYGITPEVDVVIGKTDGVMDLGEGIAAGVGASMSVLNKVLKVAPSGITEDLVATFAVSEQKLKDGAVATRAIVDGNVTTQKYANLSVTNAVIANLAISTANIQDTAITTAKIANAAITNALIGNLAVSTAQIQDLAVTDAKIAALSVGKLVAGSISVVSGSTVSIRTWSPASTVETTISPGGFRAKNTAGTKYVDISQTTVDIKGANQLTIDGDFLLANSATAGVWSLPSNPKGFIVCQIDGFFAKIPYYGN